MAPAVTYLGNIIIGAESPAYQSEVRRYLELIRTTKTGRTLFTHINRRPTTMTIVAFKPTPQVPVQASASPVTHKDAIPKGLNVPRPPDRPDLPEIIVGTGVGSAAVVTYHPATWRQLNQNMGAIAPGAGPGEALFHEMIHGYRMQRGELMLGDDIGPEPIDEFYAVMAANVYRSERGFKQLRGMWSDRGFAPLKKSLSDSELYYEEFKTSIDQWFGFDRSFCLDMAKVAAPFNPFNAAAIALGLTKAAGTPMALP